jgi:hypothetical protein
VYLTALLVWICLETKVVGVELEMYLLIAEFDHPRFVGLEPKKQNLTVADLDTDLWEVPESKITSARFEEFEPPNSNYTYDGSLTIKVCAFQVPEFDYEATRRVDVTDTGSHFLPLPTARLRAEVKIENLDETVIKTLKWYSNLTNNFGAETVYKNMLDFIDKIISAVHEGPDQVNKIFSEYEKQEKKFRFFARKVKNDPTTSAADVLLVERPADPLGVAPWLISEISKLLNSETDRPQDEAVELLENIRANLSETSAPDVENSKDLGITLRLRKSFAIQAAIKEVQNGQRELPRGVDPRAAKQFADDFFHLLMHFWNNVIRYFKYEEAQHWVEEVPGHASGLFYVRNRVTLDGTEILPQMTAHVRQEVLRHNLIDRNRWAEVIGVIEDGNRLQDYEMDWTVDGILSQAISHLTKGELLSAIVLGGVALEEAMTRALFHVDPEKYDEKGIGEKIRKVHKMIGPEELEYNQENWIRDWRYLNFGNKETGNGLTQVRRRLQHPKVGLDKKIPNRPVVAEMILATQRMCRALLKYERHQRYEK